jgi:hypothetical protein
LPPRSRLALRHQIESLCESILRPEVLIRVVLYAAIALYFRTILFDYVYDDNTLIILNPWMESWKYVGTIFSHSFWGFLPFPRGIDFYRPLVMLAFVSIYHFFGPAPGWFHLFAAGVHVLATYLTYRLVSEATGDKTLAAVAAGIFGLHPTKVETAAWISGLSDSLAAAFFLGSLVAYFRWRRAGVERGRRLAISLVFLALAFLSKESAIFAPALIAIFEFQSAHGPLRQRCYKALRVVWPFAVVSIAVLIGRILFVQIPGIPALRKIAVSPTLLTAPQAILWYLGKQLWPTGLSVQYPMMEVTAPSLTHFALPLCILLLIVVLVAVAVRNSPVGIFFSSWFVLMLAPVILYHIPLQEHDRYCYLASVATSVGLACLILRLKRFGIVAPALAVVIVLALISALTVSYAAYWDNDAKLFTRAVRLAPDNINAWQYLADTYVSAGQPERAKAVAHHLIDGGLRPSAGWYILGFLHVESMEYSEAEEDFQKAIQLTKNRDLGYVVALANVDLALSKNSEAIELYQAALKRYPGLPYLTDRLALARKQKARAEEQSRELALRDEHQ